MDYRQSPPPSDCPNNTGINLIHACDLQCRSIISDALSSYQVFKLATACSEFLRLLREYLNKKASLISLREYPQQHSFILFAESCVSWFGKLHQPKIASSAELVLCIAAYRAERNLQIVSWWFNWHKASVWFCRVTKLLWREGLTERAKKD